MTRLLWVAGKDRLAHAHLRASSPRTLCNETAVPEQFGYPATYRCAPCEWHIREMERQVAAARQKAKAG